MLDQVAALADLHGDTFEPDYNALFAIPTLWERESEDGDDENGRTPGRGPYRRA